MPPRDGFRSLGSQEHNNLLKSAIRVQHGEDPCSAQPVHHSTHTVKQIVEVPYEDTVRVPVKKKIATVGVEQKVVRGVELIPVKKYKEVEETVIEVQEKEVKGVREVWVKKKVPYTEIVKKPVKVTKVRKIPYTDYEEKEVEVKVDVPCHKVEVQRGYREDKVLKTRLVEVEQDVTLEHRPTVLSRGAPRAREIHGERHHGTAERGHSVVRSARPMSARPTGVRDRNHRVAGQGRRLQTQEWTVRLNKPSGQILGIHVDSSGGSVVVQRVDPGVLRDWNARHPGQEVCAGDRIVAVNGTRGDAQQLMRQCGNCGHLELVIRGSRPAVVQRPSSARGRSTGGYR